MPPAIPDEILGVTKPISFMFCFSGRTVVLPKGFSASCNESALTGVVVSSTASGTIKANCVAETMCVPPQPQLIQFHVTSLWITNSSPSSFNSMNGSHQHQTE